MTRRLVAAVGADALRRCVPAQALEVLEGEKGGASPTDVASLARSVHGVAILKQLRPPSKNGDWSLRANGLDAA